MFTIARLPTSTDDAGLFEKNTGCSTMQTYCLGRHAQRIHQSDMSEVQQ